MSREYTSRIRCDRCGYESDTVRMTNVRSFEREQGKPGWGTVDEIDLCPRCKSEYDEMMNRFMRPQGKFERDPIYSPMSPFALEQLNTHDRVSTAIALRGDFEGGKAT